MILVTGATGQLGRTIVERLLQLVPAEQIGVSVRDPQKAQDLSARGVSVRRGDFAEPASLPEAFAGAQRLMLISTDAIGRQRSQLHRNAVDAARAAGVQHIVYSSVIDPDPASPFVAAIDHADTESYIRASGLRYTILRNGLYAESLPLFVGPAFQTGALETAADGPAAYVTREDLGIATAQLLAEGGHIDQTLDLTGAEALDLAQVATIVGELLGQPIERRVLSDADYHQRLLGAGMPQPGADIFLSIFRALHEGRFSRVDPALSQLLRRPPTSVRSVIEGMLASTPA